MNSMGVTHAAYPPPAARATRNGPLWQLARDLEANFLAEMMKSAGVGKARDAFGGGSGEDQFSSFLVREYADATARAGGIGLRESIYRALAGQVGQSS